MNGRLTTHVLDTATGRPAAGMAITLSRLHPQPGELGRFVTNDDGRADGPLLEGVALIVGEYELLFHVGDWQPGGFYASVPIRFRVTDPGSHHHVPLILSPFGYATYRGS